jgi:hypothetical protein
LAERVLEAAIDQDKRHRPKAGGGGDYSKSFAGTKDDTRVRPRLETLTSRTA